MKKSIKKSRRVVRKTKSKKRITKRKSRVVKKKSRIVKKKTRRVKRKSPKKSPKKPKQKSIDSFDEYDDYSNESIDFRGKAKGKSGSARDEALSSSIDLSEISNMENVMKNKTGDIPPIPLWKQFKKEIRDPELEQFKNVYIRHAGIKDFPSKKIKAVNAPSSESTNSSSSNKKSNRKGASLREASHKKNFLSKLKKLIGIK